jgi:hypothetical protein
MKRYYVDLIELLIYNDYRLMQYYNLIFFIKKFSKLIINRIHNFNDFKYFKLLNC